MQKLTEIKLSHYNFLDAFLNSHTNAYLYFATKKTSDNPGNPVPVLMPLNILIGVSTDSTDMCML